MASVAQLLAHTPRLFVWLLSKRKRRNLEREVFLRVIQPGMTVFDVGANVGDYTRLFSVLTGPRGAVHAFEPIPQTHKILARAVDGRANVCLHQMALGDATATRVMTVMAGDFGQASLADCAGGAEGAGLRETIQVPVGTLDQLMVTGAVQAPGFIKIDVEGAERMVLRGATATLAAHKPVLFFEVFADWTRRFGYTPLDLLGDVEALGYTECYLLDSELRRLPVSSALAAWPQAGSANVLALPPTPFGAVTRRRLAPLLTGSGGMVA